MKKLVMDSNALIALFDGDRAIAEMMSRAERILIPAVVLGEVRLGFNGTKRSRQAEAALESLLDRPNVEVLPVSADTGSFYVSVMTYLKKSGHPIPMNDVWIAAGVLETGSALLSRDAHFDHIPMISRFE